MNNSKTHVKFDRVSDKKCDKLCVLRAATDSIEKGPSLENNADHVGFLSGPGVTVTREPTVSPLRWSEHRVFRKDRTEASVADVIKANPITLLFFGSPSYPQCCEMALRSVSIELRAMENAPEVIYIPVYTYRERASKVMGDFEENHGDWWMMGYQSLGTVEAVYMCDIVVLPTVVVVNSDGVVVSSHGQLDLTHWGDAALIAWS